MLLNIGILTILIGWISSLNNRYNYILILLSFELILIGFSILFLYYSIIFDDFLGSFFTLILFSSGALDTAIGLTILIFYWRYY